MLNKITADQIFRRLENLDNGRLHVTTPDGQTRTFEGKRPGQTADIHLHDWRVARNLVMKGNIGFAEDYREGKWSSGDLIALNTLGLENKHVLGNFLDGKEIFRKLSQFFYLFRANSLKGSKRNIHAHYDLGNAFYKLWLDPSMTYSSALFDHDDQDLVHAQHNKYDRIIDCLDQKSGSLLEVGCGWGGFAERAQEKGDYGFRGITLSEEQHAYAGDRLGQKADVVLEDYRIQNGKFDNIVSIEMFEAVGMKYWPTYFSKMGSLLNSKGKAVIQTITINEADFDHYSRGGDFIRSYIFPGGMLPSPSQFSQHVDKAGMRVENEFYFGQHYALTLEKWLQTFDKQSSKIQALGFDDGFMRLWRMYLAGCVAAFRTGHTNVMQVELSHA